LRIGEMSPDLLRVHLDLQKTVVLIPGGILEEHGPYLPSYTDGYADDAYTRELAKAIVARPGWTAVLFPQIPLGNDPANTIGGKTVFPGSYPVRMATLRAMYVDSATELGDHYADEMGPLDVVGGGIRNCNMSRRWSSVNWIG
jgi:creatinine amidohydrolase/Fe(II)-dependent formamide hydrolase-like protein